MKSVRLPLTPPLVPGTDDWDGALIFLTPKSGEGFFRPAAFFFDLKVGLAWVEPSYADPYGTPSTALHFRFGRRVAPTVVENENERIEASRYYPECDGDMDGEALAWFDRWIASEGRSRQSERARVWKLIREDVRQAIKDHLATALVN